jgi:hypothetical protein
MLKKDKILPSECYKCNDIFKRTKGSYFRLRKLNYLVCWYRQEGGLPSEWYVMHQVSGCGHGEYICYIELATGGPQ